jgi:hypothetical protein
LDILRFNKRIHPFPLGILDLWNFRKRILPLSLRNQNLTIFVTRPAKGAERGWQEYLWDSPMEQTEKNGEAVSSRKRSTAHYAE